MSMTSISELLEDYLASLGPARAGIGPRQQGAGTSIGAPKTVSPPLRQAGDEHEKNQPTGRQSFET
jgi:hypothetical protein